MNFIAHRDPFHVCYVLAPDGKGRSFLGCKHDTPRQAVAHTAPVFAPARSVSPSYPSDTRVSAPGGGLTEDPAAAASLSTAGDSPRQRRPPLAGGD